MTMRLTNLCRACVHFHKDKITCDAFPGGIPDSIVKYGADHRKPIEGDHGIQFELIDNSMAKFLLKAWEDSAK